MILKISMFGFYSRMGGIVSLWFKFLLDKLTWMLFGDQMNKSASKWTWVEKISISIFLPHHKFISHDKAKIVSNRSKYNCRNPSLGLATKAKGVARLRTRKEPGNHSECSKECKKVSGSEPSHSQREFNFGSWNSDALPNLQKKISRVKTPWLEEFFIPLESSWNLDV